MGWRRDVRRFRQEPVPENLLKRVTATLALAPSVGLSQPWRIVNVKSADRRAAVRANFLRANQDALAAMAGQRGYDYARLKLEGLDTAPEQLAVFCDPDPAQGHGLGRQTMPEAVHASAVCAIMQMWLMASACGLGMGWVSILDPQDVKAALDVDPGWRLVAYLCLGWPKEQADTPELERVGWEYRRPAATQLIER